MSNPDVIAPTVNFNGANKNDLQAQQRAVYGACFDLLASLRSAAPHPRDYQTTLEGVYIIARTQWEDRMKAVEKVQEDCMTINRAIGKQ